LLRLSEAIMPKEHPEWFDPNEREEDGRWKKGVSGNPKGRGHSRGKATMAVEAMLGDELDRLTRKAVELALGGDTTALKICLDRIAPIRKGAPVNFPLPPMETAADLPVAVAAVSEAMSVGLLSPEEAMSVTAVLDIQRRAIETAQLEQRIRALEEGHAVPQRPADRAQDEAEGNQS
jgi:Family of unknown function (DUF5681)